MFLFHTVTFLSFQTNLYSKSQGGLDLEEAEAPLQSAAAKLKRPVQGLAKDWKKRS
jgi:hypothetical protein